MYSFPALIGNFPLMLALLAWLIAQVSKFIITMIVSREDLSPKTLLSSGGMPSSHTAMVCALPTSVAITHGFASPLFAICCILSFIVMYDATGVRRSAGEQAKTLNQIIIHLLDEKEFPINTTVKEILGHTPLQVLVGALLGIFLPIAVKFIFKL